MQPRGELIDLKVAVRHCIQLDAAGSSASYVDTIDMEVLDLGAPALHTHARIARTDRQSFKGYTENRFVFSARSFIPGAMCISPSCVNHFHIEGWWFKSFKPLKTILHINHFKYNCEHWSQDNAGFAPLQAELMFEWCQQVTHIESGRIQIEREHEVPGTPDYSRPLRLSACSQSGL